MGTEHPKPEPKTVTRALNRSAETGDPPLDEVYVLVYKELQRLARREMTGERSRRTIDTTVLIHEAFMRLTQNGSAPWDSRWHFYGAAARAMRRILVDAARRRKVNDKAIRRIALEKANGGNHESEPASIEPDVVALDAALTELESFDARLAEVVMLRYFAGLSVEQTAEAMSTSARTVKRDWQIAKAWLYRRLASEMEGSGS